MTLKLSSFPIISIENINANTDVIPVIVDVSGVKYNYNIVVAELLAQGGDAYLLEGELPIFYLTRENHIGKIDVADVNGLGNAATKTTGLAAGNLVELDNNGKILNTVINTGSSAGNIVQLDGNGKILNSLINTGSSAGNIVQLDGNGKILNSLINTGTSPGNIVQVQGDSKISNSLINTAISNPLSPSENANKLLLLDGEGKLPAVDGSNLTGISINGADAATLDSQLPSYYLDRTNHSGTIDPSDITGLIDINNKISNDLLNIGTAATNLVQLNSSGKISNDLLNIGTAATNLVQLNSSGKISNDLLNVGTAALNLVQLNGSGKISNDLLNVGTAATNLVQLNGSGKISNDLLNAGTAATNLVQLDGTGKISNDLLNVGFAATNLVQLDGTGKIPDALLNLSGGGGGGSLVSLTTTNTYTKAQRVATVALTDATSIVVNASLGNVFSVTLAGNRTLANPTNLTASESGQTFIFLVKQDATGSRTLAYGSMYKWPGGTAPAITTTGGRLNVISAVFDGTFLYCNLVGNYI